MSEEAKAALKERDRLWDQTQKLRAAGKLSEAIAAAEAMLAIDRKVLPAGHADLAVSLDWLAMIYSDREDFAAAKVARQQALEVLRKRHWKVTDARLALEDVDRRARMTRDQRQSLAEADRLNREVVSLDRAGKDGEALKSARWVLACARRCWVRPSGLREQPGLDSLSAQVAGGLRRRQATLLAGLAIRKEVLGERHPDYAASLDNLARLLELQGDYAAARPLFEHARRSARRCWASATPTTPPA